MNTIIPYAKINTTVIRSYDDVSKMSDRDLLDRAISFDSNTGLVNSWIQNEILRRMSFHTERKAVKKEDKEQEACKCGHSKHVHGKADANKCCYEPGCECKGFEQQYIVVIIDSVITYEEADDYGHAETLFEEIVDMKRGLNVYLAKVVKFEATPLEEK